MHPSISFAHLVLRACAPDQRKRGMGTLRMANRGDAWPFAEYRFKNEEKRQLLREARRAILDSHPDLAIFFKADGEI